MARDRLGEVAARRRDRADDADAAVFSAYRDYTARALVKFREAARKVGGEALLRRDFLKASRELAQSLGPARGGVRHYRHVVAHVAEIFGYRDAGVYRRFACRDRHVRGVRYQYRAFHERAARARILEDRELLENVRHFIAAFAAADVDDNLCVAPLSKLVLRDRLSRAESARDAGRAALGEREEAVDDALPRYERLVRQQAFAVGARRADGPALYDRNRDFMSEGVLYPRGVASGAVLAGGRYPRHFAFEVRRHHYLVDEQRRLLNRREHHAARDHVADLRDGRDVPYLVAVYHVDGGAGGDVHTLLLEQRVERAAYAVEEAAYESRTELYRKRLAGAGDVLVNLQAVRVFVDLYRRVVAVHLYYLAHQLFRTDVDDLAHTEVAHSGGLDDRAVYKFDCTPMEGAAVIFSFQKPSLPR